MVDGSKDVHVSRGFVMGRWVRKWTDGSSNVSRNKQVGHGICGWFGNWAG